MFPPEISESQMMAVGTLSLLCFLVGTTANFLSIFYFLFRNKTKCTISRSLFSLINGTDLLICILALPVSISALSHGRPQIFSVPLLCDGWVFLWYTLCRYSLFLIAVLSIARTHSLVKPLSPPEKHWVLLPAVLYLLLLLLQETFPYWFGNAAHYDSNFLSCVWFIAESVPINSIEHTLLHLMFVVVETGCPIVVIMASSIYSCIYLHARQRKRSVILQSFQHRHSVLRNVARSTLPHPVTHPVTHHKTIPGRQSSVMFGLRPEQSAELRSRSASVTIVMIGGACFLLNIPFLLLILVSQVEHLTDCEMVCLSETISREHIYLLMFLVHTGTMEINSVINPFIYIARIKRLRSFICGMVLKCEI